jgi:hypothetical protein
MTRQNEERQRLERVLAQMEKHLLTTLERTFTDKKGPTSGAPRVGENPLFQRFLNRPE